MTNDNNDFEWTDEQLRSMNVFDRVSKQLTSRRNFLGNTAKVGGGALALSTAGAGTALAGGSDMDSDDGADNGGDGETDDEMDDNGDGDDVSVVDVLNFALTLEQLEATFYEGALASSGGTFSESDIERSDAARIFADDSKRFSTFQRFETIRDHERTHVEALTAAVEEEGGEPVSGLEFEFPYETVPEFIGLAQTFEDTGVGAYIGASTLIDDEEYLQDAAQILAVEARHASYIRVLNTQVPFPNAFDPALAMAEVQERVAPFIVSE